MHGAGEQHEIPQSCLMGIPACPSALVKNDGHFKNRG